MNKDRSQSTIVNLPAIQLASKGGVQSFDANRMTPAQKQEALEIAAAIDFGDTISAPVFGSDILQHFNRSLDSLLEGVKIEDMGRAGDVILEAGKAMDSMKLKKLRDELRGGTLQYILAHTPFLGKYLSAAKYFVERKRNFQTMVVNMERNTVKRRLEIIEYQHKTDRLIKDLEKHYDNLGVLIMAGEYALSRGSDEYDALCAQARESGDALLYSKAHSLHEQLIAMDTRVMEIKIAYAQAPISGQQLGMANAASRASVHNIQNLMDFTIPAMKQAVFQAASMFQLEQANRSMSRARVIEQSVAKASMEMLGENYIEAKRQQGDGYTRAAELANTIDKVVELVNSGIKADVENAELRRKADIELSRVTEKYRTAVHAIETRTPQAVNLSSSSKLSLSDDSADEQSA